jgi:Biotin-requiring enzyme
MTRRRVMDRATGEVRDVVLAPPSEEATVGGPADSGPGGGPADGGPTDGGPGEGRPAGSPSGTRRGILVEFLGDGGLEVVVDGWRFAFDVEDADRADLRARASSRVHRASDDGPTEVRAIIPGRIAAVAVVPGDVVVSGARLLSVEAMKMENEVRAPRAGTVTRVAVAAGETVELGDVLVVLR